LFRFEGFPNLEYAIIRRRAIASEHDKANRMLTTATPFDSKTILDGIRRRVEIQTLR
jgi:hypothetical protein